MTEYFSPTPAYTRISAEWLLLAGGTRAVLLELAHPLVAAGVAEHSNFQHNPYKRLIRTLYVINALGFGKPPKMRRGKRMLQQCHRGVSGHLVQAVGPFPAGTPYDANDLHLRLWVFATLIDTTLLVYQRLVGAISTSERAEYYESVVELAQHVGIPSRAMPPNWQDFDGYVQAMLNSETLTISEQARQVCTALFFHNPLAGILRSASLLSLNWMPPHLREGFGLQWSAHQQSQADLWETRLRGWRQNTPIGLWRRRPLPASL